jgi:predicted PurR-regulated permease PerM
MAKPASVGDEQYILFRPRNVLSVVTLLIGVAIVLWVVWIARTVVVWIIVAAFLSLALNPAVAWLQRHGVRHRGAAVGIVFLLALAIIGGAAALIIPPLIRQIGDFIAAVPGYVSDLTHGRGPFGFLETKYQVVEKAQAALKGNGGTKILTHAGVLVSIGKGIATFITATLTITFLTLFMLLEGPAWLERFYAALPESRQDRFRAMGHEIYRTVGGYVNGNLLISVVCGVVYGVTLAALGVKYALALASIAALLDLVPLAGATIGGILVAGIAFAHSLTAGVTVVIVVVGYQQLENHILQPVIYGKTVDLSPLAVLISVLIGATVAGLIGALGAIPIAGTLQVVIRDYMEHRRREEGVNPTPKEASADT